jgi:hypothetical protein
VTVATSASCVGWYPESQGFPEFHQHDEGCRHGDVTGFGQGTVLAGRNSAI